MLTYSAHGPTTAGRYLVLYPSPGCDVPTVACICTTEGQATTEADRLNQEQVLREAAIRADQAARGLRMTSGGLGNCFG